MKITNLLLVIALPLAWAVAGYFAGPLLARPNFTVQLAERIQQEDAGNVSDTTFESDAFRATGRPAADLYADARLVESRFRIGAAILGAWCGLALAFKLIFIRKVRPQDTYEIDHATCVSCGRCFVDCPRGRVRLRGDVPY